MHACSTVEQAVEHHHHALQKNDDVLLNLLQKNDDVLLNLLFKEHGGAILQLESRARLQQKSLVLLNLLFACSTWWCRSTA